ncbi:MAG: tetratricopeptide repeat protein [Thermodesulfobacteriota bacterium]
MTITGKWRCILLLLLVVSYGCGAAQPLKPPLVKPPVPLQEGRKVESVTATAAERKEALKQFNEGLVRMNTMPEEAVKSFSLALMSMPYFPEARYNLGLTFLKLNDTENARREIFESLKSTRQIAGPYEALGAIYMADGETEKAVEAYGYAAALERSPRTLVNLANAYQAAGELDSSLTYYEEAESEDPENPYLHYNMGMLLLEKGKASEAVGRLKRALTLREDHPEVPLTLAKALLLSGDVHGALEIYTGIMKEDPGQTLVYRNMGIIYEIYLRDYDKAVAYYTSYLSMDGEGGEGAKEVRAWIDIARARAGKKR